MVALPTLNAPELLALLLALELEEQSVHEQNCGVHFGQNRNVLVYGSTAHVETISNTLRIHRVRDVNEHVDVSALDAGERVGLAAHKRFEDLLDVANALLFEPLLGALGSEDLVAHLDEELDSVGEVGTLRGLANGNQNVLLRHLKSGGDKGLEVSLIPFFTKYEKRKNLIDLLFTCILHDFE